MTLEYLIVIVMGGVGIGTLWVVYKVFYSDLPEMELRNADSFPLFPFAPNMPSFIEDLVNLTRKYQAILLFVKKDQENANVKNSLFISLKNLYGEENVHHLVTTPYDPNAKKEEYFLYLGKQCKIDKPTPGPFIFMQELEQKVQNRFIFLLVSEMEQNLEKGEEELAGIFRSLNERYPDNFRILIIGGEKLANQYYTLYHDLSLFNHAEAKEWPELKPEDVILMLEEKQEKKENLSSLAGDLLRISGGHPLLLEEGLEIYLSKKIKIEDLQGKFIESKLIWRLFGQFSYDSEKERLYKLLQQDTVGDAHPHLTDPLLRKLYWSNLVKKRDDGKLVWRCEAIQLIGKKLLSSNF